MDRYVIRLETAESKAKRQVGNKLKLIQINCGYKGIAESHHGKCVELRNYLQKSKTSPRSVWKYDATKGTS